MSKKKTPISIETKQRCVEMHRSGVTSRQIYDEFFSKEHEGMTYESFRRVLKDWKRKTFPDPLTLDAGTYDGFVAHGATVQVNGSGEIIQAWIKQTDDDRMWEDLLWTINSQTKPVRIKPKPGPGSSMLEIPLYDMHLPLSDHTESVQELLSIVTRQKWQEINIILGQDLFHNDDMRGRTASGRQIEKVNIAEAWNMARSIWFSIVDAAIKQAEKVRVIYSVGNHDESLAWAFTQLLKERYPQIEVDDSMKQRKCIYWDGCFIGITHGAYTKSTKQDLRGQFTIEFPQEFAGSSVREIHAGHLHHEEEKDLYGVMVRRLSRNGELDQWSEDEGYVGAHRRFMIFEYAPGALKAIDYI